MTWDSLGNITILITDDDAFNRQLIISLLNKIPTMNFFEAKDGIEALEILDKNSIDMILLDLHMPKMNGYDTLKIIKKESKYDSMSTIIITTDEEEMKKLYLLGVDDFISKPFDLKELESRIYRNIEKKKYQKKYNELNFSKNRQRDIKVQDKVIKKDRDSYSIEEIEINQKKSFYMMAKMCYMKNNRVKQIERVALLAQRLSLMVGYDKKISDNIYYATFIKDIGQLFIKNQTESLDFNSKESCENYKSYIASGYQLLSSSIETEFIKISKKIMIQHKEHYDGTGFPYRLKEKEIHLLSYIVSLVEVFDTLLSGEKYLDTIVDSKEELYDFLNSQSSHSFHPKILKLFLDHFDYFVQLREKIIKQH